MLQVKVQGGTPQSGRSLCATCKLAQIVKGQNCEEYVRCAANIFTAYRDRVPFRVANCSAYHPSNMPWMHEMEQMAWVIQARKRGPAGFRQAGEGEMEVIITQPRGLEQSPTAPTQGNT